MLIVYSVRAPFYPLVVAVDHDHKVPGETFEGKYELSLEKIFNIGKPGQSNDRHMLLDEVPPLDPSTSTAHHSVWRSRTLGGRDMRPCRTGHEAL